MVADFLVTGCKSGDLLLIAHALNAFFDIFSEANYNQTLATKQIIDMMRAGLPQLNAMVSLTSYDCAVEAGEEG